ncbi:MAG: hypothetical protein QXK37_01235 [Candidatus Woesearchaeota archaeon]
MNMYRREFIREAIKGLAVCSFLASKDIFLGFNVCSAQYSQKPNYQMQNSRGYSLRTPQKSKPGTAPIIDYYGVFPITLPWQRDEKYTTSLIEERHKEHRYNLLLINSSYSLEQMQSILEQGRIIINKIRETEKKKSDMVIAANYAESSFEQFKQYLAAAEWAKKNSLDVVCFGERSKDIKKIDMSENELIYDLKDLAFALRRCQERTFNSEMLHIESHYLHLSLLLEMDVKAYQQSIGGTLKDAFFGDAILCTKEEKENDAKYIKRKIEDYKAMSTVFFGPAHKLVNTIRSKGIPDILGYKHEIIFLPARKNNATTRPCNIGFFC